MLRPLIPVASLQFLAKEGETAKRANIQALRGIAAMMVVIFHGFFRYFASLPHFSTPQWCLPQWAHYGESGVDVFFVISGFVMVYVTRNRCGSFASQRKFLVDRITRIYPPYWIATLPVVLVCIFLPNVRENTLNVGAFWHSLALFPGPDQFPLLRVGWTLIHEMYFYLVFSFFLLGKRERLPLKLWIWAGCVIAAPYVLPAGWLSLPWVKLVSNAFALEFIAGCFLALAVWPKVFAYGFWLLAGGFLLLLLGTFMISSEEASSGFLRPLFFGIPSVCIVGGALAMECHGSVLGWSWLQRLGDASFQIYLWHTTLLAIVSRYALKAGVAPLLCLVLTIASSVAVSYCIHLWGEKPILKWTRSMRRYTTASPQL